MPATIQPSTSHQVRLSLRHETVGRLLDLQARAVKAGRRKPTYSQLIDAAVARLDGMDLAALLDEETGT